MKKILGYILPIGLAGGLLYFTYKDEDFGTLWQNMKMAHLWPILATFATTVVAHLVRALRWNMLLQPVGYKPSAWNSFLAVMSGYFVNQIIPRAGEVSRCTALVTSEKVPMQTSIGTVLVERGFDMVMLLLIGLTAFGLEYETLSSFLSAQQAKFGNGETQDPNLKYFVLIGMMAAAGLTFIFRKPLSRIPLFARILNFGMGLLEGIIGVTRMKNPLLFMVYTILIWGGYYMTTYFSLYMFDFTHDLGFKEAFMLLIIGSAAVVVPVPGALAPFPLFVSAALVELYFKEKVMSTSAASMMYWSQVMFTLAAGGTAYLITVIKANQKLSTEPEF